ncbi:MAG: tetratricopeptide repeat protein, partial [Verrucomicrobiota bacterium]|nr:tetratricopeptide repeat protein [Verrucomicrobiota bacterium]
MNAKEHLEKAIALNPEYSHAYYNLGLLHKKKGEGAPALENFQKAVSLNKEFAEAECELAIALSDAGDY